MPSVDVPTRVLTVGAAQSDSPRRTIGTHHFDNRLGARKFVRWLRRRDLGVAMVLRRVNYGENFGRWPVFVVYSGVVDTGLIVAEWVREYVEAQ